MSRYECDCGAVYSHQDQLVRYAENRQAAIARNALKRTT